LVWALVADIRSGETTFYRGFNPMHIYRRDENEADFWQQITYGAVVDFIALGLGVWLVYHGWRNL